MTVMKRQKKIQMTRRKLRKKGTRRKRRMWRSRPRLLGRRCREPGRDGMPVKYEFGDVGLELFDLSTDPGETKNVADAHPEIVKQLQTDGQRFREDLGDELTKTKLRPDHDHKDYYDGHPKTTTKTKLRARPEE